MTNYPCGSDTKDAPWNQGDAKEGVEVIITIKALDEDDALDRLKDYLEVLKEKKLGLIDTNEVKVDFVSIFLEDEEF
jgi:hypothetical protein